MWYTVIVTSEPLCMKHFHNVAIYKKRKRDLEKNDMVFSIKVSKI